MEWLNSLFGGVKDFGSGLANMFTGSAGTNAFLDADKIGDVMNNPALNSTFDAASNTISYNDLGPDGSVIGRFTGHVGNEGLYNTADAAKSSLSPSAMTGLAGIGSGLAGGLGGALGAVNKYAPALQAVGTGYGAWKQGELGEEAMDLKKDAYNFKKDTILKRNAQSAAAYNNGKAI